MDLRKTLTLCLAVLLVAGFSPQSMAIEGDPSGWLHPKVFLWDPSDVPARRSGVSSG